MKTKCECIADVGPVCETGARLKQFEVWMVVFLAHKYRFSDSRDVGTARVRLDFA